MPDTDPKYGVTLPLGNEIFNRAAFRDTIQDLIDAMYSVTPLTTVQRDAFTAAQKWVGRLIRNTTTAQYEWWDGAAWVLLVDPGALAAHEADTTNVHGITDTAQLSRLNASTPFTVEQFIERTLATDPALSARVVGDANPRVQVRPDGILFGAGGASALDTLLKRTDAANTQLRNAADNAYRSFVAAEFKAASFMHRDDITRNLRWGTGSPEGVVTASVGSEYLRTDGATGTVLYVKESGTGTTGWVPKGSAPVGVKATSNPFATTSTTYVDVPGLSVPVAANEVLRFIAYLSGGLQNANGAQPGKMTWAVPAGASGFFSSLQVGQSGVTNRFAFGADAPLGDTSAAVFGYFVMGIIRNGGTAGTLKLQIRDTSGSAGVQITLDSWVEAGKVS